MAAAATGSAGEAFQRGCSLFVDENFEDALAAFTQAIERAGPSPTREVAEYYVKRAACHSKLQRHTDAVGDANAALALDPDNAVALLRKGMACFALDEFEAAREAFRAGLALEPNNTTLRTWLRKCEAELAGEEGLEAEASGAPVPALAQTESSTPTTSATPTTTTATPANSASTTVIPPKEPKVKHTWYQNDSYVYLTLYQRDLEPKDVSVELKERTLDVTMELPDGTTFVFDIDLCDSIVPAECKTTINKANVEIKLKKSRVSQWTALEAKPGASLNPWPDTSKADKHTYPSSSRKKLNWDKLAQEVEEDKLEGDAALNKVFQDIYAGATEEQRRAMMKSFLESNGTVLSTNWEEVGKAPVRGSPPKGMEEKRYDE